MLGAVDAPADKRASVAMEQDDADAGTIGQIFNAHWRRES
jgi:hypothetical protein